MGVKYSETHVLKRDENGKIVSVSTVDLSPRESPEPAPAPAPSPDVEALAKSCALESAVAITATIKAEVAAEVARTISSAIDEDEDGEIVEDPEVAAARAYSQTFRRDADELDDPESEDGDIDEEASLGPYVEEEETFSPRSDWKQMEAKAKELKALLEAFNLVMDATGDRESAQKYIASMRALEKAGRLSSNHPFVCDEDFRALGFRFPGAAADGTDDVMATSTGEFADLDEADAAEAVDDGEIGSDVPRQRHKKSAVIMGPRRYQQKAARMKKRRGR